MRQSILILALVLLLGGSLAARASGSYPGRAPRPPAAVNSDKYNLGKQVFAGKAPAGQAPAGSEATQAARLKELQSKLPKGAQKNADLPALAGKLSADQLQALEYFLEIRYRIK